MDKSGAANDDPPAVTETAATAELAAKAETAITAAATLSERETFMDSLSVVSYGITHLCGEKTTEKRETAAHQTVNGSRCQSEQQVNQPKRPVT